MENLNKKLLKKISKLDTRIRRTLKMKRSYKTLAAKIRAQKRLNSYRVSKSRYSTKILGYKQPYSGRPRKAFEDLKTKHYKQKILIKTKYELGVGRSQTDFERQRYGQIDKVALRLADQRGGDAAVWRSWLEPAFKPGYNQDDPSILLKMTNDEMGTYISNKINKLEVNRGQKPIGKDVVHGIINGTVQAYDKVSPKIDEEEEFPEGVEWSKFEETD